MITELKLKNFRCFQDFTLDGIRPITLIAGTNNVGKSTILESLFLLADSNSSNVFLKINNFRGIAHRNLSPQVVWESLFPNMETELSISISVKKDGNAHTAVFSRNDSFSVSALSEESMLLNAQGMETPIANSYPLKLSYKDEKRSDTSHFIISENRITLLPQKPIVTIAPHAHYFGSKVFILPSEAAELFGKIEINGNKARCVDVLKLLDNRIKDLSVILTGGIAGLFADVGLPTRLAVNMLGDGINKLMSITLLMLANPGSLILVDEIENGFHYSFFPKLWEVIGKLATDTKCQIFATTHSYECIDGATSLAVNASNLELFRFIRLEQNDGIIVPQIFDNDSFEYAIKSDWEVR